MDWPPITDVTAEVYEIPTDQPEADGTLAWSSTIMVTVTVRAGDVTGLGWTYAAAAAKTVIDEKLASIVAGACPADIGGLHESMVRACRNLGRPGVVACAISAIDIALWDLKARLVNLPLPDLFGRVAGGRRHLRQRWVHYLLRRNHPKPTRDLGEQAGHPPREDQDRRIVGH